MNFHCDSEEVQERHIIENIYYLCQFKMHLRQKHLDSSEQSGYEDVLCYIYIYIKNQRDAAWQYVYLKLQYCSTCFGRFLRPSSASETCRAILQLQINILPSCITLVLYIYIYIYIYISPYRISTNPKICEKFNKVRTRCSNMIRIFGLTNSTRN